MQYLAFLTTKGFIACVWTFGCCKQPTSTTGSIMVWLKRRLYMNKYVYMYFAKYLRKNDLFLFCCVDDIDLWHTVS